MNRKLGVSNRFLFWLILSFTLISRILYITTIPGGVNQDEAMLSLDAWALSEYATDRFGTFLPVHFAAWQYSQMSVLLGYIMVPFIKILGFNLWAIRLPIALISTLGVALLYLISNKLFSSKTALVIMALGAINPWHFMQSRWALDCNLFPHVFLLAFYFLLLGLEKHRYLYASMFFFGLTFYCYGIAVYTVPIFLLIFAIWCLTKRQLPFRTIAICFIVFMLTALPEILTMVINLWKLPTIETPFFTIPFFPESVRSEDILFMNFSLKQLVKNILAIITQVFLQFPDHVFNTLPMFGPLYHISIPFIIMGIIKFIKTTFSEKDIKKQTINFALIAFLSIGIFAGIITKEVNVNRINIIFYPLIILCGYGIQEVISLCSKWKTILCRMLIVAYSLLGVFFLYSYFCTYSHLIKYYFHNDFMEIVHQADSLEEYDSLYITNNLLWLHSADMSEIMTQYICKLDSMYVRELTTTSNGRSLLPYSERYHFISVDDNTTFVPNAIYVIFKMEQDYIPSEYEVLFNNGHFYAITLKEN